jgi:tetratricopeptide (TPR) repeat protein
MMKKAWLTVLLIPFMVACAKMGADKGRDDFADDFNDKEVADSAEDKDDLKNELKEEKSDEAKDSGGGLFGSSRGISDEDLKKLSQARKSRSEGGIIKAASEILGKDPQNKFALNTLAVFYFENKKFGLSKILLKRALKDHPDDPALHNNLGIVYLAQNEMRLALDAFKKSLEARSSYQLGATNLSSIYLEYRDYKRSIGPLEDSFRSIRSDLRRGSSPAVEIANNYALALMGVGESGKAEGIFKDILESDSRNPVPLLNYASLLVEVLKKKKDAIRVISKLKFMTEDREILRKVEEIERKME